MRNNGRFFDLVALLVILAASELVYDTSGKVALVMADAATVSLYRLWRSHGAARRGHVEVEQPPDDDE